MGFGKWNLPSFSGQTDRQILAISAQSVGHWPLAPAVDDSGMFATAVSVPFVTAADVYPKKTVLFVPSLPLPAAAADQYHTFFSRPLPMKGPHVEQAA